MKRIILLLAVAAMLAVMFVVMAGPAFAQADEFIPQRCTGLFEANRGSGGDIPQLTDLLLDFQCA